MDRALSIYLVAGEASGDNHGAALMQALRLREPEIRLLGRGGPQMKRFGGERFIDWSEEAGVVGLWEVVKHYGYFREEFRKTLNEIAATRPDAVVLIDYPGFNLRLARVLRGKSFPGKIIYYISPQVWAWNRGRIPKMAKWLDLMLCIFPFEAELYQQSGLRTIFVGHPMIENLEARRIDDLRAPHLVGLFPGSRTREVRKLLPILIEVMRELHRQRPELHFEIAAASEALAAVIRHDLDPVLGSLGQAEVVVGAAAQTMQRSTVGVVASGTATLEAAFFRLPFVLVYKVAALTYLAGRMLIRVKHLGMPNVLAGREIVPEFIQGKAQPAAIARAMLQLLDDRDRRQEMLAAFEKVIAKLGQGGANEAAARAILQEVAPLPAS
ncbi:MAG: lipid-A-disaccharide synthase [Chthoniobacterales bacterium]